MLTVLISIQLVVVIALIATILLQRSEGGGLGSSSNTGNFMTGRGQANALTRTTAILGALFFITSLSLTLWANFDRKPADTLQAPMVPVTAPANDPTAAKPNEPAAGTALDALRQFQEQRDKAVQQQQNAPGAPAAPVQPNPVQQQPAPDAPASGN